jgi:excisionase family DNA binding protein
VGEERDTTQDIAQDRVTIQEAAQRLGVKEDAIRKRIQRGSIRHEKAEDGRVYVLVDAAQDATQDTKYTTQDATQDTAQDERLEDFREQVGYLRRQLDEEREARRRADTIIAQLARANEEQARTIRELEAPRELPGDVETVEEAPEGAEPHAAAEEAGDELGAERALREMAEERVADLEADVADLEAELEAFGGGRESPQTVEKALDAEPRFVAPEGSPRGEPRSRSWWRTRLGSIVGGFLVMGFVAVVAFVVTILFLK